MQLLRISAMGGLFIAVIWLLRLALRRRLPAGCFTALWLAASVRLLLPVSLPSRLSIYNLLGTPRAAVLSGTPPAAASAIPPLDIVWLIGAGLMLAHLLLSWLCLTRTYRDAQALDRPTVRRVLETVPLRRRVRVRVHARVAVPFTYGVLRPVILLPPALADADETLRFVLLHELCHVRRWDCLRKLLFALTRCVHWFNPLVWLLCRAADTDLEHACDAAVLRLGGDCRRAYAAALLQMAAAPAPGLCSAFRTPSAVEERIVTIMTFKHRSVLAMAMSAAVFAATTSAFAADAQPKSTAVTVVPAAQAQAAASAGDGALRTETGAAMITYLTISTDGQLPDELGDIQLDADGSAVIYDADGNPIHIAIEEGVRLADGSTVSVTVTEP